jgi:hypothetical protein
MDRNSQSAAGSTVSEEKLWTYMVLHDDQILMIRLDAV